MHNATPPKSSAPRRDRPHQSLYGWLCGCALVCLGATVWGAASATESLWLDELHSDWAVSGQLSDVAQRARQGNQSPLFFWGLYAFTRTLGIFPGLNDEFKLRLPSLLAWGGTIAVCWWQVARAVTRSSLPLRALPLLGKGWSVAGLLCAWLLLDRVQLFYASEARVYAIVQLLSLLAWLAVAQVGKNHATFTVRQPSVLFSKPGGRSPRVEPELVWCGLSCLLVFLHITSALAIAWQIVWGSWLVHRSAAQVESNARRAHGLKPAGYEVAWRWWGCVAVVVTATALALVLNAQVWERRLQWASFAGSATLLGLLGLFPLMAYVMPVVVARGVDWVVGSGGGKHDGGRRLGDPCDYKMWIVATAGPWLTAWGLTALGIAPLFHQRFVFASALPLALLAACELCRVRYFVLRLCAGVGVVAWLITSQGTLASWQAGRWFAWQRTEGWYQASEYLRRNIKSGDQLWCASGLIEGSAAQLPLSSQEDSYLSFPLRGSYAVVDPVGQVVAPHALVRSGRTWAEQLLADPSSEGQTNWIVYRGTPAGFQSQLIKLSQRLQTDTAVEWEFEEPSTFGLVSVCRIEQR